MTDMADVLTLHAFHLIMPVEEDLNGAWQVECNCDADPIQGESFLAAEQAFAAHQAAALSAAGFGPVQEAQREAWADGHESGFWNGRESAGHHEMRYVGLEHAQLTNPYRKASDDGS